MSNESPTDNFSIELFCSGDRGQLKRAYELYYMRIFTLVYNLVRNTPEAQDITIDTFVKLWRQRANFEHLNNINAFLYVASRNACLDYLRKQRLQQSRENEVGHMLDPEMANAVIKSKVISELVHQDGKIGLLTPKNK